MRVPIFLALLAALLLTGCGGPSVVVKGNFPDPLVRPLPLHTGVWFTEEFKTYVLEEEKGKGLGKATTRIEIGDAQRTLFERLFKGYFEEVTFLSGLPSPGEPARLNGIISPELMELQYSTPGDTKTKVYEVWLKFKLNLYGADGTQVSSWSVTGYGKTPTRFMKGRDTALQQAAVVALRDAGAHFATRFERVPTVKDWLSAAVAVSSSPEPK